jgi:uncharacterized membrane protein YdbT with pleckstrin-like domain
VPASRIKGLFSDSTSQVGQPQSAESNYTESNKSGPHSSPITTSSNGEVVVWEGTPSQVLNLLRFCVCGFFCLVCLILAFLHPATLVGCLIAGGIAVWNWYQVKCTKYVLTNERYRRTRGVLSRRIDDLELYRVKDTSLDQPLFLRLFTLANIEIMSSDISTPRTVIKAIAFDEANRLREITRKHVEELRTRKRVREIDTN